MVVPLVMGYLLVALATIEGILHFTHRPLLSHQRGWKRVAVLAAGAALVGHVIVEGVRDDIAAAAAEEWRW